MTYHKWTIAEKELLHINNYKPAKQLYKLLKGRHTINAIRLKLSRELHLRKRSYIVGDVEPNLWFSHVALRMEKQ